MTPAEIGVDTSTVQRVDAPTRDIYNERTLDGDPVVAGFTPCFVLLAVPAALCLLWFPCRDTPRRHRYSVVHLLHRAAPHAAPAASMFSAVSAEIGVDTSTVQRVDAPTRDIYVERTLDGDRVFAGFGLESHKYCDCALDAEKLPKDILSVSAGL